MPKLVPVLLPVDGPMDTTGPASNREPGVLVDSTDCDHRWWGPRTCLTQQTWPYQSAASFPNRRVPIHNGNTSLALATMGTRHQINLPSSWTLEMVVRPSAISHSAADGMYLFRWQIDGFVTLALNFRGPGAAAGVQRTFQAQVTPTTSAGVPGTTVTLNGTTQVSMGTGVENDHVIRVVRDGSSLYLYVDNNLDNSTTSTNLGSYRHESTNTGAAVGYCFVGDASGTNSAFAGRIYKTVLKTSVDTTASRGARDYLFAKEQATRFALYGSGGLSADGTVYEQSPFRTATVFSGATYESLAQPDTTAQQSVQGMAHFSDTFGRSWNVVMAGGTLYWRRVL